MGDLTRTRRAYNKAPIEGGPGYKGWIKSVYDPTDRYMVLGYGLVCYHPWTQFKNLHCIRCRSQRVRDRAKELKRRAELEVMHAIS